MLRVSNLGCERDQRVLFSDLSFTANAGDLIQIIGPNGAGKTTLLRILCGLYQIFDGQVHWRLETAPLFLGHKPGVKDLLSVAENLRWACRLQGQDVSAVKLHEVLQRLGLDGYQDIACGHLSEGQRKRVNLARLFLLSNPVWLLDEPFGAIDAQGVECLEAHISRHVESGGLVLLTSHQRINTGVAVKLLNLTRGLV